jgi:hypothetical protein
MAKSLNEALKHNQHFILGGDFCNMVRKKKGKKMTSSIKESSRYRNIHFQHHLMSHLEWVHHVLDIYHPYGCHLNGGFGGGEGKGRAIMCSLCFC